MIVAFGAPVRLDTQARDLDGELVDAVSITVTIQLPDGTTTSAFTPVNDGTGLYHYIYQPTIPGRHIARWLTTSPGGADEESFSVAEQWSEAGIISRAEAKQQLNIDPDNTDDDEEIDDFIRALTDPIERIVGSVVRRTYTEKHEGGRAVALQHAPVLQLVSVTAIRSGVTAPDLDDLDADGPTGIVERKDGAWICGPARWVYLVGQTDVLRHVALAARLILQHMWETQRGVQGKVRRGGSDEVFDPRFGFSIPRRAQELLGVQVPGVA